MKSLFLVTTATFIILTIGCTQTPERGVWSESSFEEFADGALDAAGNLYAAADGSVRLGHSPDLNGDGWPDIVLTNAGYSSGNKAKGQVFIYWGGEDGFDASRRTALPQGASHTAAVGDLNNDGRLDLLVNGCVKESNKGRVFTIFLGGKDGFAADVYKEIPLYNAFGCAVADIDNSGWPDIAIAGSPEPDGNGLTILYDPLGPEPHQSFLTFEGCDFVTIADLNADGSLDIVATSFSNADHTEFHCNSLILWNKNGKFLADRSTPLPSYGGHGATVADLNDDGHLDVVINNFGNFKDDYEVNSTIFYGSANRFAPAETVGLPTMGACESSAADLNGDGRLDLLFADWAGNKGPEGPAVPSYIYWGGAKGFSADNKTELPSVNGVGGAIVDYNKDSYPDILINNTGGDKSFIYWGGKEGYSAARRTELESYDVYPTNMRDFGNAYDRKPRDEYLSSVYDAGGEARWLRATWQAEAGKDDFIEIFLRVGPTAAPDEKWSRWLPLPNGPDIENPPAGRYAQYKAVFNYAGFSRPVLQYLNFEYRK